MEKNLARRFWPFSPAANEITPINCVRFNENLKGAEEGFWIFVSRLRDGFACYIQRLGHGERLSIHHVESQPFQLCFPTGVKEKASASVRQRYEENESNDARVGKKSAVA